MEKPNIIIKELILIFVVAFLISSCDQFLTTTPSDQYTQNNFWKSDEEAQAGLTGVYQVLRGYPAQMIFYGDQLSPNAVRFDDPGGWRAIARGTAQTTNDLFGSAWSTDYRGIGRANTVISKTGNNSNISDATKKEVVAEAKFLRAFFYADLVNKFGGVPLILKQPSAEQADMKRAKKGKVLTQILKDLTQAASALPEDNDPGRATKGAALALKARVFLYNKRWSEAAKVAKKVMNLHKYSLFPNYRGLFMLQNEHNSEVIWDIEFKLPKFGHSFDDNATTHAHPAPLKGLADAYYMKDGKPASESSSFDPKHPYQNRDPRLYATIRLVGSMYNGQITKPDDVPETHFGDKKWTTYSDSTHIPTITGGLSEINPIVIRYAGVLLIYAEAENEAVGPNQSVYDAINQIRQRTSVDMPKVKPGLSQDEMRKVIHHERRIELAMGGYYYNDIRRWGIAKKVMNGPVFGADGNVFENRTFQPKDTLWAIPSNQIDLNPNLKQNPGW